VNHVYRRDVPHGFRQRPASPYPRSWAEGPKNKLMNLD
jgi:hypothetical protein